MNILKVLILGAGVSSLATALSLHNCGIPDIAILKAAPQIEPLGVGENLPSHATRELYEFGLESEFESVWIKTSHLAYHDLRGGEICTEVRGLEGGYKWPQYSVHWGRQQMILYIETLRRLGKEVVRTGCRVTGVTTDVRAEIVAYQCDGRTEYVTTDLVTGADGIKSAVHDSLRGKETKLIWNGWVMHRGTTYAPQFLDGKTVVIVSDEKQRVVIYPIEYGTGKNSVKLNWILTRQESDNAIEYGDWNQTSSPTELAKYVSGWSYRWLEIEHLIGSAQDSYEYPLVDFDTLDCWTFGRNALLGDAAHSIYPIGSNSTSQAILDARFLTRELATKTSVDDALASYESERRTKIAAVQLANRRQADEVMVRVSSLAAVHSNRPATI